MCVRLGLHTLTRKGEQVGCAVGRAHALPTISPVSADLCSPHTALGLWHLPLGPPHPRACLPTAHVHLSAEPRSDR